MINKFRYLLLMLLVVQVQCVLPAAGSRLSWSDSVAQVIESISSISSSSSSAKHDSNEDKVANFKKKYPNYKMMLYQLGKNQASNIYQAILDNDLKKLFALANDDSVILYLNETNNFFGVSVNCNNLATLGNFFVDLADINERDKNEHELYSKVLRNLGQFIIENNSFIKHDLPEHEWLLSVESDGRSFAELESSPRSAVSVAHKRYKCSYAGCGKSYKIKSLLNQHMNIHTGETPYKCNNVGCDYAGIWSSNLGIHKRICKFTSSSSSSSSSSMSMADESESASNKRKPAATEDDAIAALAMLSPKSPKKQRKQPEEKPLAASAEPIWSFEG